MSDTQETMTTEAAAPEATPEKPKRGRPRKKAEEAPAPAPAPAAEGAEASAAPAKKTTRRRAAAKPAEEAAAPAATEAPTAEEAPKPRRTRARKTPEPAAEEGTGAATHAAPTTSETSEEAPKPRRARARKAASEPTAGAEEKAPQAKEPEGAEASAAGTGTSEAPAAADAPESKEAPRRERTTTTVIRRRDREERRQNQSGQNQNGQGQGKNSQNKQNAQNSQGGKKNKKNRHENRNREPQPSVSKEELTELKVADLRARAAEAGVDAAGLKKAELVDAIYEAVCKAEGFAEVTGVLDIMGDGYGFLRTSGYLPGENDIYVGLATIRKNGLRKGDMVTGTTRPARPNDKFAALQKVSAVNGMAPEIMALRPKFADLTPVFPDERLLMEHGKNTTTARVIDLVGPHRQGPARPHRVAAQGRQDHRAQADRQRPLRAEQPRCAPHGHPGHRRASRRGDRHGALDPSRARWSPPPSTRPHREPHARWPSSSSSAPSAWSSMGQDVVVLLDSHHAPGPRLQPGRSPPSGRILSGGVDSTAALYPPKRFFGAARNIESGGSLTIIASALVETGSKMDEVIFEEFKGTGNMELTPRPRHLAERRIFPAIDPNASGTRQARSCSWIRRRPRSSGACAAFWPTRTPPSAPWTCSSSR